MFLFLVSCFSFIILSKISFSNLKLNSISFQSCFKHFLKPNMFHNPIKKPSKNTKDTNKNDICLLDLPDLPLECILEKLSPTGLANMSGVCKSFRGMCTQDHLWEKPLSKKWGKFLMGEFVCKEWKKYVEMKKNQSFYDSGNGKGYFRYFTSGFWFKKNVEMSSEKSVDSVMAWYVAFESGKFSFPAQVYNRENGNVGFLLSCYDAKVTYDSHTDSFTARYSAYGRPTIEENIKWERLRSQVVDVSPYDLHVSDCLTDLQPGDHFEIQWRKSKEFPYGWWYGVVGHLESCDGNKLYCQCHRSDTVILEFKQYNQGSRWREVAIDRKDHREVGNETDGFYAGIRKLYNDNEISIWKGLWPTQPLE